jgi:hypothetical protein
LQHAVPIQKTHAFRATDRSSFIDLPAELRYRIYELVLLFKKPIRIKTEKGGGKAASPCPWAIMATCREIYHESARLYYGGNTFEISRGAFRDFFLPRSLDLPFPLVRTLVLSYPQTMGVGSSTYLSHAWGHFIRDAHQLTAKFRNLDSLKLAMRYDDPTWALKARSQSWDTILEREPGVSDEEQARRVRGVVLGLNRLEGRRLPACVSFVVSLETTGMYGTKRIRPTHDLERLNEGLRLAASHR